MTLGARDALDLLGEAALALTFAIAVAWAIRAPLRRYCGAGVAYAAWALPPVALLALALPAPTVVVASATVATQVALPAAVATAAMPVVDRAAWWCALWLCGALAMTAHQWRLQRRFVASLGDLQNVMPGLWRAQSRSGLPALIGLLRPRIVLPADFDTRYDAEERALMLAHERAHLRRGDPWANLAAVALRIVFWFHPLVHLAASRFRDDQELACDQRVIASAPQARRRYGEAMLKTLVAAQPVPLGCHWGLTHPMKERLMHLQASPPRRFARVAGIAIACLATAGTAFAVWSAQTPTHVPARAIAAASSAPTAPASPTAAGGPLDYVADIRARMDDGESEVFVLGGAYGESIAFSQQTDDGRIDVEARIRDAGQARYDIAATIERDGRVIASPRLIVASGKAAVVRVGDEAPGAGFEGVALELVVRPPPPSASIAPSQPAELSRLPELPQLPDLAELPRVPTSLASASPLELEAPPAPPSPPDPPAAPAAPPAPPAPPQPLEPLEAPAPPAPSVTVDETAAAARQQTRMAKQHAEAARRQAVAAQQQAQAGRQQAQASKAHAEAARQQAVAAQQQAQAGRQQAQAAKSQAEAARRQAQAAKQEAEAAASPPDRQAVPGTPAPSPMTKLMQAVSRNNASGKVVLEVLLGKDGRVKDARVVESVPAGFFDQATLEYVRTRTFPPFLKNGEPVEAWGRLPFEFDTD
jgi:bla regulator protein BlaR1